MADAKNPNKVGKTDSQAPKDLAQPLAGRTEVANFDTPAQANNASSTHLHNDRPSKEPKEQNPKPAKKEEGFVNDRDPLSDPDFEYFTPADLAKDEGFDPAFLEPDETSYGVLVKGVTLDYPYTDEQDVPDTEKDQDHDGSLADPVEAAKGTADAGRNTPREALARAKYKSEHGVYQGVGMCLFSVRDDFLIASKFPDAISAWKASPKKHRATHGADVPRGAPVFWGERLGHVALSAGGGLCWSTDVSRPGYVDIVRIDEITQRWGKPLLGWSESLNGVLVWTKDAFGGDGTPPSGSGDDKHNERVEKAIKNLRAAARNARREGFDRVADKRAHFADLLERELA